jgi:hypothetical protein
LIDAMLGKDPAARPAMAEVAQQLKALGNLQSEVVPMRIVREPNTELRGPAASFAPPRPRSMPSPKPAPPAKPPLALTHDDHDPDATALMKDDGALPPPPPRSRLDGEAPQPPTELLPHLPPQPPPQPGTATDRKWQPALPGEPTAALRIEELNSPSQPQLKSGQQRLGLLVFIGLVVVSLLLVLLVLLVGGHGDGAQ